MTYEKVISAFKTFLTEDDTYDVVNTKHGYTVLNGEADCRELYSALLCRSPEELRDTLLDAYREYRTYQLLSGNTERALTKEEMMIIESECEELSLRCNQ